MHLCHVRSLLQPPWDHRYIQDASATQYWLTFLRNRAVTVPAVCRRHMNSSRCAQGLVCPAKACDGIVIQSAAAEPPAQAPAAADSAVAGAVSAAAGGSQQTQEDRADSQADAVPNGHHQAFESEADAEHKAEPQPSADAVTSKPPGRPSTTWQCLQCGTAMPAQGENNSGCEQQASGRTPRVLCILCTLHVLCMLCTLRVLLFACRNRQCRAPQGKVSQSTCAV